MDAQHAELSFLGKSEQKMVGIINFLPDATFAIDTSGTVIIWNQAMEEMTGISAHDVLGKGNSAHAQAFYGQRRLMLVDLILAPNKKIEEELYAYIDREKDRVVAETELISLNNKHVFLWGKAAPLFDKNQKISGAIESIRDITEKKQAKIDLEKREVELRNKTLELENLNTALRVLLNQREKDKELVEENILKNIQLVIIPYMEKLKLHSDDLCQSYLQMIESTLNDIASPFTRKFLSQFSTLTKKEIQIVNLIKNGMSTKDIATFLNVSESAINIHRYRIRKKLSLTKSHNLRSFLTSVG